MSLNMDSLKICIAETRSDDPGNSDPFKTLSLKGNQCLTERENTSGREKK